jgi:hypothetical protein
MIKHISKFWFALLLLLAGIAFIAAFNEVRAKLVHAATPTAGVTWTCNPDLVVSANVRVVAHCASGYVIDPSTTIYWFAYPTKDSANASRMLSLFETAKATNSTVTFYFDTNDLTGVAYGCLTTDCRGIWAATTP